MFKMSKDRTCHFHALLTMVCQEQCMSERKIKTSDIMRWTNRSRKYCIAWMKRLESRGWIIISEDAYRPNRTAFVYEASKKTMRLYKSKYFQAGYQQYFNHLITHHDKVFADLMKK